MRVAFVQQPGRRAICMRWNSDASNANISGTDLHVYGEEDWQSGANWSEYISENEGMLLISNMSRFRNSTSFLEHDYWGTPAFSQVRHGRGERRAVARRVERTNPAADVVGRHV
jgi:hypothetical protein